MISGSKRKDVTQSSIIYFSNTSFYLLQLMTDLWLDTAVNNDQEPPEKNRTKLMFGNLKCILKLAQYFDSV